MGDILYQELWGASGPQYGPWFGGMVLSTLELDTVVLLFGITVSDAHLFVGLGLSYQQIFWCYIIITNAAVDGMASTSVVTLVGCWSRFLLLIQSMYIMRALQVHRSMYSALTASDDRAI
ncbi:hypothetical protein WOLCODRAFT_16829 [Wolfiporia cocos MD-104 SS10]|uniref:Uncharacterized protein n=1 Tax=Wolfiporia cocos (strain MD-104) TaxID=742152 RepID=A0A2H3JHI2_WOLCO|nr:hypothetical protein WOLCODRAFT_16829 [Wolfiporia cocos MD-104 SS10]